MSYLLRKHDRVSFERVLSGSGLHEIYEFLRDSGRGQEPGWLTDELANDPPPVVISRAARDGRSELCRSAVNLFVSIYGAEAGNLALKLMARGGVIMLLRFPKTDPITLADEHVEFEAKIGELQPIKKKFKLKDLVYAGSLAL